MAIISSREIPMKAVLILFVLTSVLSARARQKASVAPSEQRADLHTSQNSLDWAGVYQGVLPCADCPGIKTRLTLNNDGTYERVVQYLERQGTEQTVRGLFTWQASGNAITLDQHGGGQQYSVGEGRLSLLYPSSGLAPNPVLTLVQQTAEKNGLAQMLERYRWTLESAIDNHNRRIAMLPPSEDHPVVLSFSGNRLSLQAPCNRMMGGYEVSAPMQLTVRGGPASTMMGCDPALMNADTVLAGILAKPLQVEIDDSQSPRLRLRSASNDTLTFTGEATPEALYGLGTTIFLEIAPQPIACEHPPAPETRCLQVRERHYDEQGLPVGTPEEWRPLYENIQGFTHKEGVRNVVRLKRFDRNPTAAGTPSTLYVLDLVVETQLVTP
jgi:heat shock protein HslJ